MRGEKNFTFGYVPSQIDGTELIYDGEGSLELPTRYSYEEYLPEVYDQGTLSICVTCSVGAYINWNINVDNSIDNEKDHSIKLLDIYNCRSNKGDGMTFKEALSYLRHHGVLTDHGNQKIERYAMIRSSEALKRAIVSNGPCVGAFFVRDSNCGKKFWQGNDFLGGHAISIVGYDEEGFIIRNSWGKNWGDNGYTKLPYDEFNNLIEMWTIIA